MVLILRTVGQGRKSRTVRPSLMISLGESNPMRRCSSANSPATRWSDSAILMPSGAIGWPESSSSAAAAILLWKLAMKIVSVLMSIAMA
jgi:hypothetical protein